MKRITLGITLILILMIITACSNKQSTGPSSDKKGNVELTVSAAASLRDGMEVIQLTYQEAHPEVDLKINFGGSGSLQRQISQGAPVDIFFSAAVDKFDRLIDEGKIAKEDGVDLLGNELVLVVPKIKRSTITSFQDLVKKEVGKISIGIPESVPAGNYAKESLKEMNIWKDIESKIVYAKDVRQVLSYVETGNVDAGMVYNTDAIVSNKVNIVSKANSETHSPITYPIGIIKTSKDNKAAKDFYNYLQTNKALKVFEEYGFTTK
ncbi:molybdate ABC transporter substrate-binding protein [Virgibacillus salarius]|uniref:molybdate ABC transporter substrate-binding protein n=1 Tax=Virgibacillus salarius TaxID=447199 RepID=UPI0031D00E11